MLEKLNRLARACLSRYELSPRATATLINYTENATYRVEDPASGNRFIFRIYRLGYHDRQAIESEIAWMGALRRDADVQTAGLVPARDGTTLLLLADDALPEPRFGAMSTFLTGTEPPEDHLPESFDRLGEVAARMHLHSRSWEPPPGFKRPIWNFENMLGGPRPIWGRWQDGVGLDPAREKRLGRVTEGRRPAAGAVRPGEGTFRPDPRGDLRWRTCWSRGTGPRSSTSTIADSAGTCTISARR